MKITLPEILTEKEIEEMEKQGFKVEQFDYYHEALWNLRDMYSENKPRGVLYTICNENGKLVYHRGLYFDNRLGWAVLTRNSSFLGEKMSNFQKASDKQIASAIQKGHIGAAPAIQFGKGEKTHRVIDLWCHVWYSRFVGTENECKEWIQKRKAHHLSCSTLKIEPVKNDA